LAKRGKISREYQLLQDIEARDVFDKNLGEGIGYQALFEARRSMNDSTFVNFLSDDDFQDFVDRYRLFVAGRRINIDRGVVEYFVKSRNGKDYRKMLNDSLYHPPHIEIIEDYDDTELYLYHVFEGRALVASYIPAVLRGLYFLARKPVKLETTEFSVNDQEMLMTEVDPDYKPEYEKVRVIYECEGAGVKRIEIGADDDVKGGD
jgi:stage V sporulation protein R